jgi:hypothetical protein
MIMTMQMAATKNLSILSLLFVSLLWRRSLGLVPVRRLPLKSMGTNRDIKPHSTACPSLREGQLESLYVKGSLPPAEDQSMEERVSSSIIDLNSSCVWFLPVGVIGAAFVTYESTSTTFHSTVQLLSSNNWIPVDGGSLIADIITPVVNGPVLSSISILFATLTATTVANLYNRQNRIQQNLVTQIEEIKNISVMVQSFPDPYREEAREILRGWLQKLEDAIAKGNLTTKDARNNHLDPLLLLLNKMSADTFAGAKGALSDNILGSCYSSISKISDQRAALITNILATFPPKHYVTLAVLASSVCLVFLMVADRDLLYFLAGFQLKALWALLIGVFALLAVVLLDLMMPFGGTYTVLAGTEDDRKDLKSYLLDHLKDN